MHVQPWIFAFDAYSLQLTNTYTQPPAGNGTGPGIWQSGAGWAPQSLRSVTFLKLWSPTWSSMELRMPLPGHDETC